VYLEVKIKVVYGAHDPRVVGSIPTLPAFEWLFMFLKFIPISILIIPLLSSITSGFFGRFWGYKGAGTLSTNLIAITCLMSYISFYKVGFLKMPYYLKLGS
jgi:hypothetical protein